MDVLPELLDVECTVVLELPDAEFDVLTELVDDVILLLEPLDVQVVEVHLVQPLDGDGVVNPCAELLGHDVGSTLLMSSSLQFVYEDIVDAPLQVCPAIFDVQVAHLRVVLEDDRIHIVDVLVLLFIG